ncbi:MAG: cysteine--tRNA ligase [Planctomycetes bacterium]|nr:cysteine--tRNA ligase [Planctomycetota bacterium]
MAFALYNTISRSEEVFEPLRPGQVGMYNCGPTVYGRATIGNFRSFIFADLLRRYLEWSGYRVTQVMNITDVGHMTEDDLADGGGEDKIQKAAAAAGKRPEDIARYFEGEFLEDRDVLNILPAHEYPRASEHVPEMIAMIEALLARGHAYEVDGEVYYDVASFPDYGKLSGNTVENLVAGARVEVAEGKRHPADFALWKRDPKHLMQWDSPWGRGFPGWHIECSAMGQKYLGATLDIHTGGEDNIFPHHECEIAQAEGATGEPFVRYWLHTRHLLVDGRKMSKRLGNVFTIGDLRERGYTGREIRYALLEVHYRKPMNFTLAGMEAARGALRRLREFRRTLLGAQGADTGRIRERLDQARRDFQAGLDGDLNVSLGLAAIFGLVRDVNDWGAGKAEAEEVCRALSSWDRVLGVLGEEEAASVDEAWVERRIRERDEARAARDWRRADQIRDELNKAGVELRDSDSGTRWVRKS